MLALGTGLFIAGLFFGAGLGFLPGLFLLFAPGYALLGFLGSGKPFERALTAFPLSVAVLGLALYVLSLFGVPVINPLVAIALALACLALYGYSLLNRVQAAPPKARRKTKRLAEPSFSFPLAHLLTLGLILLAFTVASIYLGKLSYGSPTPITVTSIDSAVHLSQMEWMIKSGTYTTDPALVNHQTGFEPVLLTPVSVLVPTVFTQLTGLKVWGGMILFVALCFAWAVAGVILLSSRLFGFRTALLAGLLLALIAKDFFPPYRLGMYRVVLAIAFTPFALHYFSELLSGKRVGLLLGLLVGALALTHPAHALLLIVPFAVVLAHAFFARDKALLRETAFVALPAVIGLVFYLPATLLRYSLHQYVAGQNGSFAFKFLPIEEVERIGAQSNTVYSLDKLPLPYKLLPLVALAWLAFRAWKTRGIHPNRLADVLGKPLAPYLATFLVLSLLTLVGFTDNSNAIEYLMKFRFTLMALFLIPLSAYVCSLAGRLPFFRGDRLLQQIASVTLAVGLMVAFATPDTLAPHAIPETLNKKNYPAIAWIEQNTRPGASVLFLSGVIQYANHFSHRVSTYLTAQRFRAMLLSGSADFDAEAVCESAGGAVKRQDLFAFTLPDCSGTPKKLCDYDYLVLRINSTEPLSGRALEFVDWLKRFYDVAYSKDEFLVFQKARPGCEKDTVFGEPIKVNQASPE